MSSDTKSPKPMPSAAEINAYVELSAARTRMRLPLAKGAALVDPKAAADSAAPAPVRVAAGRALPLQGKLPVHAKAAPGEPATLATAAPEGAAQQVDPEAWRPFPTDDER